MSETANTPLSGKPADAALTERVMASVPVSQQAFSKLLSLLDIRTSDAIPTACVTLGGRSRLMLNPKFIETQCRTDEALAMLVMHELYHILLGHTRMFERVTPAQNIAFDAVINAQLCLLFPEPAYTSLFRNLYPAGELPWALLRPPEGWGGDDPDWSLKGVTGRLHQALYTDTSVTYGELFKLLNQVLEKEGSTDGLSEGLLGNHGETDESENGSNPEVLREIRDIVARWPMLERRSGRDDGGTPSQERLRLARARKEAVGVIRRALWPLLDLSAGGGGIPQRADTWTDTCFPYRSGTDRRAELKTLLGEEPLFFHSEVRVPGVERHQKAHVYVDVSGSMSAELPLVYGALVPLLDYLHPEIHLFSTVVGDVSPARLKRGEVKTAWGTDIACVTGHMIAHRVRRALIVTDGWVGYVPGEHRTRLERRGARVNSVVTRGGDREFAAAFKGRVRHLPELV